MGEQRGRASSGANELLREGSGSGTSTLEDWLEEASGALSLPPGLITERVRGDLLDLTRDVAHNVARIAGPLTCYLVGMAVANGTDPSDAVAELKQLVADREPAPEAKPTV